MVDRHVRGMQGGQASGAARGRTRRRTRRRCLIVAALAAWSAPGCSAAAARASAPAASPLAPPSLAPAAARQCVPVAGGASSHFDFRSSFWLNLHNFLFKEARRRRGMQDEGLGSRGNLAADTAGSRPLTDAERRAWTGALDYYDGVVTKDRRLGDSLVVRINNRLTEASDGGGLADVDLDPTMRAALLAAAPVYREVWWPAHDRRNAAWVGAMRRLLVRHEACLADRAAAVFATAWQPSPIRVDATVYASWFGAYTTLHPAHITISSSAVGSQEMNGLELLLHEGGHTLLARLDSALAAAAERRQRRLPAQLSHLLLFYTTGELVRGEVPGHVPYAETFGIWRRNETVRGYRALIAREWQPYLDGRVGFADAVDRLVVRLPSR
jgi:hypothetical protein